MLPDEGTAKKSSWLHPSKHCTLAPSFSLPLTLSPSLLHPQKVDNKTENSSFTTWSLEMGTEQNYHLSISNLINTITGTTFIKYVPYTKDTHMCFQFFTVATVHIVIFWVVTVCSPEGGNHVSVKHVASIFGQKQVGWGCHYVIYVKMQDRILWISPTTFPATCLQNVNTSSPYSHTQQEWQLTPLQHC